MGGHRDGGEVLDGLIRDVRELAQYEQLRRADSQVTLHCLRG